MALRPTQSLPTSGAAATANRASKHAACHPTAGDDLTLWEQQFGLAATLLDRASVTVKSNAKVSVAPQWLDGEKNEHADPDWMAEELLERVFS